MLSLQASQCLSGHVRVVQHTCDRLTCSDGARNFQLVGAIAQGIWGTQWGLEAKPR